MSKLIEVELDENTKVYLETSRNEYQIDNNRAFEPVTSNGRVIKKAKDFLETSLNQICAFSSSIADSVKNQNISPDELEMEFSVKFSADAGIIISNVCSEANVSVKLKWSKSK